MIYFVTGTDTDSGKTLVSSALLTAVNQCAPQQCARVSDANELLLTPLSQTDAIASPISLHSTLGVKPIASGCLQTSEGLRNSDALQLMAASSVMLPYETVNPFTFEPAIAPHIAAANAGVNLHPDSVIKALDMDAFSRVDFCLIEGAGGWRLPLGQGRYLSEVVQALNLPVILVVGMKLGCLNHALLTQEAILADGLTLAGWVANQVDPNMSVFEDNLASLQQMMTAPYLGCVPHLATPSADAAAPYLNISALMG